MLEPLWRLLSRVARLLGVHTPPGPQAGLWSWRYLDRIRTARMVLSKRVKGFYRAFPDRYPPGAQFPAIALETTDGRTIDTRAFRGQKHFVLFTGAIT